MAKPKLNQIIAVVAGKKSQAEKAITEAYHVMDKPALFEGLHRVYTPKNETGEQEAPERKNPQFRVSDLYAKVRGDLVEMLDVVATQDWANTVAKADIVVEGKSILLGVPVPYLLFLEKQVQNFAAYIQRMPVRDPAEDWIYKAEASLFVTPGKKKNRTKKIQKVLVKYEATKEHPAQTEMITEDEVVGTWDEIKFSGAITQEEKDTLTKKVRLLSDAVKVARETANSIEVEKQNVGAAILDFVFAGAFSK